MNKRIGFLLVGSFLFFYILNWLMPLAFGDDYLYAFVWQGNPMHVPLTEDAVRVASLRDLITSQYCHYFTWSGRTVSHILIQFFLWAGKSIFNVFNALVSVFLALEIYWLANKGKITFEINLGMFCWIIFVLWTFSPGFPQEFFWLSGACNYLWTTVFLLAFILPYIRKYYFWQNENKENYLLSFCMLFLGIIAGCTNENSICFIIPILTLFILECGKNKSLESWMYIGLAGMMLGYAMLMLSPGNLVRLFANHGSDWLDSIIIMDNLRSLAKVFVYQFLLWYFCLRSLFKISYVSGMGVITENEGLKKDTALIKILCVIAMSMSVSMLFSPEFHLRSAFSGTVQLIVATGIVLRIQQQYDIELMQPHVKKVLSCIGIIYFVVSAGFTLHHLHDQYIYNEMILSQIAALKRNGNQADVILNVESLPKPSKIKNFLSGYHSFDISGSADSNSWTNVAFARYYGIKGIRMVKHETEKGTE